MEKNIANLEIKTIPLDQLQGWDKNPREITDDNFRRLKRDLVKYAMLTPLIVDGRDMKTDLGISVIRDGKKLTLEEARDGKGKKTRAD